jgi:peptide deformylase
MSLLAIRIYPDPVLRARCREVETFDETLARLVDDMVETMHAAPGIGLAANQVGVETRVAVVDLSAGERREDLLVLVNPELLTEAGEEEDVEGCLSIPDFTEKVTRPLAVKVRANDLAGKRFEVEAEGLLARAICHEMDHLAGKLFTDRLRGLRRERARRVLRRLEREREQGE